MDKLFIDKLKYERQYQALGCEIIAGVDEAGRGPLAGPVVCAAVILPLCDNEIIKGVDDSKKLSAKKRQQLFPIIMQKAIAVKISEVSAAEIDSINIYQAVKLGMKECIEGLSVKPDIVLCDAMTADCQIKQISIVKGDAKSYLIGAASIVAKVYRDGLMEQFDKKFPLYGFAEHKGYGTKSHIEKLKESGPCEIHRSTFIKNFWDGLEKTAR